MKLTQDICKPLVDVLKKGRLFTSALNLFIFK